MASSRPAAAAAIAINKRVLRADTVSLQGIDELSQIAFNAGEDGSIIVGKILEKEQYGFGFNAQTGEYVNMMSAGIIDPTKVVRAALQGAASIAGLLITTEAMVAEKPQKKGPAMPPGGGMGGMDF